MAGRIRPLKTSVDDPGAMARNEIDGWVVAFDHNPTQEAIYMTSATNLNLAGSAEAPGPLVRELCGKIWPTTSSSGTGTDAWNALGIPLQATRINLGGMDRSGKGRG